MNEEKEVDAKHIVYRVTRPKEITREPKLFWGGGQNGARLVTFKPPLQQIWAVE